MRKHAVCLFLVLLLAGCSRSPDELTTGLELRSRLLQSTECAFDAEICADYGDRIHTFTMHCQADSKGDLAFTVIKPDTISGITGKITGTGGSLIFDDTILHFELLTEQQLSPIAAPWILIKTLRSGAIVSASREDGNILLSMDDRFEDNPLRLDIGLDAHNNPLNAEILYDGRRILSVTVDNFVIL